ncbi:Uncharacterised protein [Legionella busanensis]|uniref:Transmembrane protein n=1 Tax=Legionella busanensis TaxID=190655 RepID=A0A378JLF6_9GAMM|nr:hypothetical protein [Legionella busanensis]STX51907.1 Uncharacterised protein [Legionella busanensis]
MSGLSGKKIKNLSHITELDGDPSIPPQMEVNSNKEHHLSIRLLCRAEISLAIGAFFGMLAVICIVFLPMSTFVSPVVITSTFVAVISAIAALVLLLISSSVVGLKNRIVIVQEPVSIYQTIAEANYIEEEVA